MKTSEKTKTEEQNEAPEWPFPNISPHVYWSMPDDNRRKLEDIILIMLGKTETHAQR